MENEEIKRLKKLVTGYKLSIGNLTNQYTYVLNALSDCQKKYDLLLDDFTNLQKECELKEFPKPKSMKKSKSLGELDAKSKSKQKNKSQDLLTEEISSQVPIPLSRSPTLADIALFGNATEDLSSALPETIDVSDIDSEPYGATPRTKTLVEPRTLQFGETETENRFDELSLDQETDPWLTNTSPPSSDLPIPDSVESTTSVSDEDKEENEPFFEVKIRKEKRGGSSNNRRSDPLSDDEFFYY